MISIRSALTKNLVVQSGRGGVCSAHQRAAAAFMQAISTNHTNNVPSSSSTSTTITVRYQTSPAYRRYLQKQGRVTKPTILESEHGIQTPSLEVARSLPNGFSEMKNESLVVIAEMGNHGARCEVLKRHIMAIDTVDYEEANKTLKEIETKNKENIVWAVLPYQVGVAVAMITGIGATPMVFNFDVAMWFNQHYVTMEIPPPSDLDTSLETGAWTWNWMEPALGTASFTLLCFQFSRSQIKKIGMKPYTERLMEARARSLIEAFPNYDRSILYNFVETEKMIQKY